MSRAHKISNLVGVLLPFLAFLVAIVLLWNTYVDWGDLAVLAIMYVITGYGVTLGFHRLLTHRSFQTFKPVEHALAALGSMAVQGPVMTWVADHRKHHAHTDKEGDPHSPHGRGGGITGALAGLWYAHMGWLFDRAGQRAARALRQGPLRGRRDAADPAQLPAVRGRRLRAPVRPRLGDRGNARGRTPRSAVHGLRWWKLDPTAWIVRAMKRLRLAWNVVEITPERQRQKLA